MEEFLSASELISPEISLENSECSILLKNAIFEWRKFKKTSEKGEIQLLENSTEEFSEKGFELGPINLEVKQGELIFVMGEVGSGKSSLIEALLGNMNKISGQSEIQGKIAMTTQEAWIQVEIKYFCEKEFFFFL
jgi:ABC-type siderophore export system fused ATPase/permease subunit